MFWQQQPTVNGLTDFSGEKLLDSPPSQLHVVLPTELVKDPLVEQGFLAEIASWIEYLFGLTLKSETHCTARFQKISASRTRKPSSKAP